MPASASTAARVGRRPARTIWPPRALPAGSTRAPARGTMRHVMALGEVKPSWATYDPSLERLDREQLVRHQLARLQPLLAEVLAHNPFYRRRFAGAGLTDARAIGTLDDFRLLPFTVKADLSADQEAHPPYGTNLTYPPQRYIRL